MSEAAVDVRVPGDAAASTDQSHRYLASPRLPARQSCTTSSGEWDPSSRDPSLTRSLAFVESTYHFIT